MVGPLPVMVNGSEVSLLLPELESIENDERGKEMKHKCLKRKAIPMADPGL